MRLGLDSYIPSPLTQTDLPTFFPVHVISPGQPQPKLCSQPPVSPGKNSSPRGPGPGTQEHQCAHTHLTLALTHPSPFQDGGADERA